MTLIFLFYNMGAKRERIERGKKGRKIEGGRRKEEDGTKETAESCKRGKEGKGLIEKALAG